MGQGFDAVLQCPLWWQCEQIIFALPTVGSCFTIMLSRDSKLT